MTTDPGSTPRVEEQLSAWLDDELPAGELELLAARLLQAPDHRARIARYALIGSHLRAGNPGGGLLALQLGERVQAAVKGPPEPALPADTRRGTRWLPYAVAACGAVLAVALVPLLRTANEPLPVDGPTAGSLAPPAAVAPVALSSNRMTSYLVYHGEYSGVLSAKVSDSNIINHRASRTAVTAPLAGGAPAR